MGPVLQGGASGSVALGCILDAAYEIARKRRAMLLELRNALLNGDDQAALRHARQLCGLQDEAGS